MQCKNPRNNGDGVPYRFVWMRGLDEKMWALKEKFVRFGVLVLKSKVNMHYLSKSWSFFAKAGMSWIGFSRFVRDDLVKFDGDV